MAHDKWTFDELVGCPRAEGPVGAHGRWADLVVVGDEVNIEVHGQIEEVIVGAPLTVLATLMASTPAGREAMAVALRNKDWTVVSSEWIEEDVGTEEEFGKRYMTIRFVLAKDAPAPTGGGRE